MKRISILGSTGSIGTQALDIISHNRDKFQVAALSCAGRISLLKEQSEIVRCKDCRYLNEDTGICIVGIQHGYKDTWFCAYGKRRDDNG